MGELLEHSLNEHWIRPGGKNRNKNTGAAGRAKSLELRNTDRELINLSETERELLQGKHLHVCITAKKTDFCLNASIMIIA